ncbi:MAG: non-hydrolyzing UDP-N-acetylglucosamine 2-epimerase [bacterium]
MLVTLVAGARPNFMKIAPIIKALKASQPRYSKLQYRLVHTGQHFDQKMSGIFFDQLDIPAPNVNLACGGGSQAEQTGSIMKAFEHELALNKPDVVVVVGDVTSTMACAITAKKMCVDCVHVEAGIRSGDMTMPEEVNRIVTDSICDHFFTTTTMATSLLISQKVASQRIHFVGNTMIDTLLQNSGRLQKPDFWDSHGLSPQNYFILTLHRPSNVDDPSILKELITSLSELLKDFPVIFPAHPRTRSMLNNLSIDTKGLVLVDPLSYLEFIYLIRSSKGIITDSGGITEEATVLDIPCITLRDTTERPETVMYGTNVLVGNDLNLLRQYVQRIIKGDWKSASVPERWDGKSAERIVEVLISKYY